MWFYTCVLIAAWILSVCSGQPINDTSDCGKEEKFITYVDIAMQMLVKARYIKPSCNSVDSPSSRAIDCEDLHKQGYKKSGIYTVWLESRVLDRLPQEVFCDMDTDGGGWTVIQRRGNYSLPKDYFFREWYSYKTGFGDKDKEFWLGNDNIFALTNRKLCSVRFDFKDMTGETRYALYDRFWIDDEDHQYALHIKEYSGTAGDSMISSHNNQKFSTKDRDNDLHSDSCANKYKGAWWYSKCLSSNINGLNFGGKHDSFADGVNWWFYTRVLIATWILFVCSGQQINDTSDCGKEEKFIVYVDIAMQMLNKAKYIKPSCNLADAHSVKAFDCEDLHKQGYQKSGIYTVWLESRVLDRLPQEVFCDMDTDGGGWTVIQRRGNYSLPKDYFFREWYSYKTGFGDKDKEFWLGNDNIFALTNRKLCSVRFDFMDMTGETRYALYDRFWIDDEDHQYALHIKEYSGTTGDSMISAHDSQKFSTKDRDNDSHTSNCANVYKGAWWYGACHHSNINGLNFGGKHDSYADGVNWKTWKGHNESLISTEIKIRSKNFKKILIAGTK